MNKAGGLTSTSSCFIVIFQNAYMPDPSISAGFPGLGYTFGSTDGNWASPPSPNPPEVSKANALLSSNIQVGRVNVYSRNILARNKGFSF